MSEQFRSAPVGAVSSLSAPDPARTLAASHAEPNGPASAASAAKAAERASAQPATPKPAARGSSPNSIRLHFKIDPKTNDVTVFMVDTVSRRVIRTIPPEELQKLNEGDLVEMLA